MRASTGRRIARKNAVFIPDDAGFSSMGRQYGRFVWFEFSFSRGYDRIVSVHVSPWDIYKCERDLSSISPSTWELVSL